MSTIDEIYEKATVTALAPEAELELRCVAVHEAGHGLVAGRLGIQSAAFVAGPGTGICALASCEDPFKLAAVAWGGVLAEWIFQTPVKGHTLPKLKPTADNVYDFVNQVRLHELSKVDRGLIEACQDRHGAALAAFEILSGGVDALDYLASRLCERSRKRFAEAGGRDPSSLARECDFFSSQFHAERRQRDSERDAVGPSGPEDDAPPCPVPSEFNFPTFLASTGATEAQIYDFVEHQTRQQAWQAGRAASAEEVASAERFFREHGVSNRDRWIFAARQFREWRDKQTTDRSTT